MHIFRRTHSGRIAADIARCGRCLKGPASSSASEVQLHGRLREARGDQGCGMYSV